MIGCHPPAYACLTYAYDKYLLIVPSFLQMNSQM
jgi:hypothetical protein